MTTTVLHTPTDVWVEVGDLAVNTPIVLQSQNRTPVEAFVGADATGITYGLRLSQLSDTEFAGAVGKVFIRSTSAIDPGRVVALIG